MSDPSFRVLGVDISKEKIDACLLPDGDSWQIPATEEALGGWIAGLAQRGISMAVMEASGGHQNLPAALLSRAGFPVAIVNPAQIHAFAKALGQRAKTDALDARLIAEFGLKVRPQPRPLPDEDQALLSELLARRSQLKNGRVAEWNRRTTARSSLVRQSIDRLLLQIDNEIKAVDREIDKHIKKSPLWLANEKLLTSVPGVGEVTARAILADLPEIGRLSGRQIAALAGVAPFARQSGKWEGRRSIYGGRSQLRTDVYMAAVTAARCNPILSVSYDRLIERGKPAKVALIAVLRRLLVILNAMIRDNKSWGERETAS